MDEKFQAIFGGRDFPNNDGMPAVELPIYGDEEMFEPQPESVPEEYPEPLEQQSDPLPEEQPSESAEENPADEGANRIWECMGELMCSTEASNAKLSAMLAQLDAISREVARLAAYDKAVETLKTSLAANQNSEKNLYKEVEEYKKDAYFTNIKPFLMFMTDMLCEMKKSRMQYIEDKEEFIAENNENSFNEIVGLLDFFIGSFENQMKIQGVEIIAFEPDSDYITGQQRISKTVKTDDPAKNGKIASVLSDCYMYGSTVLRAAKVTAYKLG